MNIANLPTIHDLRKAGQKVRISHFRHVIRADDKRDGAFFCRVTKEDKKNRRYNSILAKGGITQIWLTKQDGRSFMAESRCSEQDAFNRRLGIRIALGRLAKQGAFAD